MTESDFVYSAFAEAYLSNFSTAESADVKLSREEEKGSQDVKITIFVSQTEDIIKVNKYNDFLNTKSSMPFN